MRLQRYTENYQLLIIKKEIQLIINNSTIDHFQKLCFFFSSTAERISSGLMVTTPIFSHTKPPAKLEISAIVRISHPETKHSVATEMTVSPAPLTSVILRKWAFT